MLPPNPSKILSKSSPNQSKTLPKPILETRCIQNASHNRLLGRLERFSLIFGGPRASQNQANIAKKRSKSNIKKTRALQLNFSSIFYRFDLRKPCQNRSFFAMFSKMLIFHADLCFFFLEDVEPFGIPRWVPRSLQDRSKTSPRATKK